MTDLVVVGNGPAAHRLVERLHHHGHRGRVTVLGAESRPPHHRALLGSVLSGALPATALAPPGPPPGAVVRTGTTASRIDRHRRIVYGDDGTEHRYDVLVLATGARARVPDVPGLTDSAGRLSEGVTALRTAEDWAAARHTPGRRTSGSTPGSTYGRPHGRTAAHAPGSSGPGSHAVVLGGGTSGVETALALRRTGRHVTLVHPGAYPMDRHLDATGGGFLTRHLATLGVSLRTGRRGVGYAPGKLLLDDGEALACDPLVLCTGSTPRTDLARTAGLTVTSDGVRVDDLLRTDDRHIRAIGDCAAHPGDTPGRPATAGEHADALATLLAGGSTPYRPVRALTRLRARSLDLAALGSPAAPDTREEGIEQVLLSDPARGRYARLVLRDGRPAGAVLIGLPRAIAAVTQLCARDLPVPSDRLALLLGTSEPYADPAGTPDETVLCHCNNVTHGALSHAWHAGHREVTALAAATRATTGCGGCVPAVRRLCTTLTERDAS